MDYYANNKDGIASFHKTRVRRFVIVFIIGYNSLLLFSSIFFIKVIYILIVLMSLQVSDHVQLQFFFDMWLLLDDFFSVNLLPAMDVSDRKSFAALNVSNRKPFACIECF